VLALSANLILNKQITGHALRPAYQLAIDRQWGPADSKEPPGLGMLRSLLIPMGIPSWQAGSVAFRKYWLTMGPVGGLLFAQLTLLPLLDRGSRLSRVLRVCACAVVIAFAISRLQDGVYGSQFSQGEVHHSVPRYISPVYLLAALPPLLFLGHCRRLAVFIPGALLVIGLAIAGAYEVGVGGTSSLKFVHNFVHNRESRAARLSREIPATATVYTTYEDKWIWSHWRTWIMEEDPEASASSIARALDAKIELYMFEPTSRVQVTRVMPALRRRGISLKRIGRQGVYRIQRIARDAQEPSPEPLAPPTPPVVVDPAPTL
jgi:hypothetical protein